MREYERSTRRPRSSTMFATNCSACPGHVPPGRRRSVWQRRGSMWNTNRTDEQQAIVAGVTTYVAGNGDLIHAYVARPEGPGPFPGIVFVHHLPGWDELTQEFTRRLANHGYTVICPDLYCRAGHGTPDDVAAAVRAEGGVADDAVVADCAAA